MWLEQEKLCWNGSVIERDRNMFIKFYISSTVESIIIVQYIWWNDTWFEIKLITLFIPHPVRYCSRDLVTELLFQAFVTILHDFSEVYLNRDSTEYFSLFLSLIFAKCIETSIVYIIVSQSNVIYETFFAVLFNKVLIKVDCLVHHMQ